MTKPNRDRFNTRCGERTREFYRLAECAVCRTESDISAAFASFNMKMLDGVVFHVGPEINNAVLLLSESVVDFVGVNYASISEIKELAYKVFVELFRIDSDITEESYVSNFYEFLLKYMNRTFSYVGPCNMFRFEDGISGLLSKYVSVIWAKEFFDNSKIPEGGTNWTLSLGEKFGVMGDGGFFAPTIGGLCWSIETGCPKDIVRQEARWMAEVFTSLVRLGIRPADYCQRAKYGKVEPDIFSDSSFEDCGIVYNEEIIHAGGHHTMPFYKVDQRFYEDFHCDVFQEMINKIFGSSKNALGKRTSDGLGWLSRGRQSRDMSERLLFFFTAIESLLSDEDQFSPVSDTIARFVSVILAENPQKRPPIYDEMRKLYGLRSSLVHRGVRSAHLLNANNVQHFAESCFSVIINKTDLSGSHREFLKGLKRASHGLDWPV